VKIYTKTGDKGKTSLVTGTRVPKSHLRLDAYGTIDELNSYIGLLRTLELEEALKTKLADIQNNLFTIASILATDSNEMLQKLPKIKPESIEFLEKEMDIMSSSLPELRNFILPGGHTFSAFCHIARTVCRRAERIIVKLSQDIEIEEMVIIYINRLSDYLFLLARKISADFNAEEFIWKSK